MSNLSEDSKQPYLGEKNNGQNWPAYKRSIETFAYQIDALGILRGEELEPKLAALPQPTVDTIAAFKVVHREWDKRNRKLFYILNNTQSPETRMHVDQHEIGATAASWNSLLSFYESQTRASIKQISNKLINLKQDGTVAQFVHEVTQTAEQLKRAIKDRNIDLLDILVAGILLDGLQPEFKVIATSLMLDDDLTIEDCKRKLLDAAERMKYDASSADSAHSSIALKVSPIICPGCKKVNPSHTPDRCYTLHPELRPQKKGEAKVVVPESKDSSGVAWKAAALKTQADSTRRTSTPGKIIFDLDSGATEHFSNTRMGLEQFDAHDKIQVELADGRTVSTEGKGRIGSKLMEVHYASNFGTSLMSVRRLLDTGKAVHFTPDGSYIEDYKTRKKIADCNHDGESFKVTVLTDDKVDTPPPEPRHKQVSKTNIGMAKSATWASVVASTIPSPAIERDEGIPRTIKIPLRLLHARLHTSHCRLYEALNNKHVTGVTLSDIPKLCLESLHVNCDACHVAKSRAIAHYSDPGREKSSVPFAHWFMDIKTVDTPSYGGNKYVAVLIDDCTNYLVVFPLKHRSDLVAALERFDGQDLRAQGFSMHTINGFISNLRRIRMDGAGEHRSKAMDKWLTRCGVQPELTSPYASQNNGKAERAIQKLQATAKTIRHDAGLPATAWAECYKTAAYLENLLPTSSNPGKKSAFEMLAGEPADIAHLRRIGSLCYVHIPSKIRKASDDQAKRGILVGYEPHSKMYRIITDTITGKLILSSQVRFVESVTPAGELLLPVVQDSLMASSVGQMLHEAEDANNDAAAAAGMNVVDIEDDSTDGGDEDGHIVLASDLPSHQDGQVISQAINADNAQWTPVTRRPQRKTGGAPAQRYDPGVSTKTTFYSSKKAMAKSVKISKKEAEADPRIRKAMDDEFNFLIKNGKAKIVDLPDGCHQISSTWAHKLKTNEKGEFTRAKSRVCPRGYEQIADVEYDTQKISSPTAALESVLLFLSIVVCRDMHENLADVDSAFTIPPIKERIYMKFPPGITSQPKKSLLLQCSLYGLKQAAYNWFEIANNFLMNLGFKSSLVDPCFYHRWDGKDLMMVLLYVDDFRLAADTLEQLDKFIKVFGEKFPIKVVDPCWYLGMHIEHDRIKGTITVTQEAFIDALLEQFQMVDCKTCSTPAAPGTKLTKADTADAIEDFPYRELVGSLLWLGRCSRPDIIYAVNQLGSHCNSYNSNHVTAAKRVLRYLKGTKTLGITLKRAETLNVNAYADADYAAEPEVNNSPMRSTNGIVIYLEGVGPIYSQSTLQTTIARSTAEAELRCVATTVAKVDSFRTMLDELGFKMKYPSVIHEDNQACIAMSKNCLSGSKTRHVRLDHAYVRQEISDGNVKYMYCESAKMCADMMTKAQPKGLFQDQRDLVLNKL